MTNRILFFAFFAFLLLVLLAPSASFASPVNTSAADQALIEGSFAVGLVGSVVLGVYALLAAFRNVREALGVGGSEVETSRDLAPPVRGFVDQQSYLDDLAMRLAAEDAARGIDFRDVETGKTNLDYMRESGLAGEDIDRSQHSEAELSAYDSGLEVRALNAEREEIFLTPADFDDGQGDGTFPDNQEGFLGYVSSRAEAESYGADMALYDRFISEDATHDEAMRWSVEAASGEVRMPSPSFLSDPVEVAARASVDAHQWRSDEAGKFREHVIVVNGVPKSIRLDYDDELEAARDEARSDFARGDGLTSAQLSDMKEVRKAQEFS